MKRSMNAAWSFWSAMALLSLALVWSAVLLAREPVLRRAQARQALSLARLQVFEREAEALNVRRRPFREASATKVDLAAQLSKLYGASDGVVVSLKSDDFGDYRLHTAEVDYESTAYSPVVERIRQAEALQPPLKLVACVFEAGAGQTAAGRVRLTFERIELR